jgi:hypothetical protein
MSANRSIAKSFVTSLNTTSALTLSFEPVKVALIAVAPSTTCQFVAMRPLVLIRKPVPGDPPLSFAWETSDFELGHARTSTISSGPFCV